MFISLTELQSNIAEAVLSVTRDPIFRGRLEAEQNLLALTDPDASMAYIEECVNKQDPFPKVMRLLCLYSLTNNGIREKTYNLMRRDILQTYGYKYLYTLENLTKIGMFKLNNTRVNPYAKIRKDFNLIIEEMNEQDPSDVAYVYSGYAPISIRTIQYALSAPPPSTILPETKPDEPVVPPISSGSSRTLPTVMQIAQSMTTQTETKPVWVAGWGDARIDNLVKDTPGGPAFHARQILPKGLTRQEGSGGKVVMVFFIGGCTFTEISAIRFLNQKIEGHDFIIGTTKLINGTTMIDSIVEKFGKDHAQ